MRDSISIVSYNTHLFFDSVSAAFAPKLVYKDHERLSDILSRVDCYDVVSLTEVWAHKTQNTISENLREKGFQSFSFQGEALEKGSSGLLLSVKGKLSPPPMSFQYYEGLVGSDALSSKGTSYGIAHIGEKRVYLIQTHTQASYTNHEEKDEKARKHQLQETLFPIIDAAIEDFSGPIFLMGDLNIVAGSEEYEWFNRQMAGRGLRDAWVSCHGSDPGFTYDPELNTLVKHFDPTQNQKQRIDYIYYSQDKTRVSDMNILKWKKDNIDDSDHYGISAEFEI